MYRFLLTLFTVFAIAAPSPARATGENTPHRRYDDSGTELCLFAELAEYTGPDARTAARSMYKKLFFRRADSLPEEVRAFNGTAESTKSGMGHLFSMLENAIMKHQNDHYGDKDLVTAMTNRFIMLFEERLGSLTGDHNIKGFKSLEQYFANQDDPQTHAAIADAFAKANDDFLAELRQLKIVRESDLTHPWFRLATGDTADGAGLAARVARELGVENRAVDIRDPWVVETVNGWLSEIQSTRIKLARQLGSRLGFVGPKGAKQPPLWVFELARKAKSAAELQQQIRDTLVRKDFRHTILDPVSEQQAQMLIDYKNLIDHFALSPRIETRELIDLTRAIYGGFTADFEGLGAQNLAATAAHLAGVTDIDQALVASRAAEKEVTADFNQRKDAFRARATADPSTGPVEVQLSGDDGAVFPLSKPFTQAQKMAEVARLAKDHTLRQRKAFFRAGLSPENSAKIGLHGETVVKLLAKHLLGQLSGFRLGMINFSAYMETDKPYSGTIDLAIGLSDPLHPLTPIERSRIKTALSQATWDLNLENTKQGNRSRYLPGTVLPVAGDPGQ